MNKTESFPHSEVHALHLHVGWSDVSLESGQVDAIQVMLSGDDDSVEAFKTEFSDSALHLDLPMREHMPNLLSTQWLQVVVRLPQTWRGEVHVHTTSGNVSMTNIAGTDLSAESVSGHLKLQCLHGMHVSLQTVSGPILLEGLQTDHLRIHSISGALRLTGLDVRAIRLSLVSGDAECVFREAFTRFDGSSVSGSVHLLTPMQEINAILKSVSGRLLTEQISIRENGVPLRFTTVTGNLEIEGNIANLEPLKTMEE